MFRPLPSLLLIILLTASAFAAPAPPSVVFLGDSLTAGYGVGEENAYPALAAARLESQGAAIHLVNAGTSGDTTAGGLRRLPWLLKQKPQFLVVALGGNDMLRGIPPVETEKNLDQILQRAAAAGTKAILFGMRATTNLGDDYRKHFDPIYARLARKNRVPLLPFFISDVAGKAEFTQADGIHPNAEGHKIVAAKVADFLKPLIAPGKRKDAHTP